MPARRKVGLAQVAAALGLLGVAFVLGALLGARWLAPQGPDVPTVVEERPAVEQRPEPAAARRAGPRAPEEAPARRAAPQRADGARIALVIDDLGRSLRDLDRLRELGIPLSYAVLPFETMTAQVVERLRERGGEILCHLPMAGRDGYDAGPGALSLDMDRVELQWRTAEALRAVPGATGVNNHMGSELSSQPEAMRAILEVVAREGLFFLDSRTSPDSVGYRTALSLGVPAAERHVFLDPEPFTEVVRREFARLLEVARERGAAVAIGHPYPATLAVLEEEVPRARELGYEFVPVSYLLARVDGVPE